MPVHQSRVKVIRHEHILQPLKKQKITAQCPTLKHHLGTLKNLNQPLLYSSQRQPHFFIFPQVFFNIKIHCLDPYILHFSVITAILNKMICLQVTSQHSFLSTLSSFSIFSCLPSFLYLQISLVRTLSDFNIILIPWPLIYLTS